MFVSDKFFQANPIFVSLSTVCSARVTLPAISGEPEILAREKRLSLFGLFMKNNGKGFQGQTLKRTVHRRCTKSFINTTSVVNVIKLFSLSVPKGSNKLEQVSLANLSNQM